MASSLHEERLDIVVDYVLDSGARSVLDLGCGDGELLVRLAAHVQFTRLVGIDISIESLRAARALLGLAPDSDAEDGRVALLNASFEDEDPRFAGFDAALLVETIEHIEPSRLARVEAAVFGCYRPATVVITTPNQEYNVVYGMPPGAFRHPGHRFEWGRARFRRWAAGVAERQAYAVYFSDIGEYDAAHGAPTQLARFVRVAPAPDAPT